MRTFTSYGPLDTELNYYVPRTELIDTAYSRLMGEYPGKTGHYITVWAPRQTGKTWVIQQVARKIKENGNFDVAMFSMEFVKEQTSGKIVLNHFVQSLAQQTGKKLPAVKNWNDLPALFTKKYFQRPVILILDEFDSLVDEFINRFANIFRGIHIARTGEPDKKSHEKNYLLHGAALIGVRSVLGIENVTGSPFNIQQSVHIPNLTYHEAASMFKRYEKESGQTIEKDVTDQIFYECRGQPGLTCWFGELLTQKFNKDKSKPVSMDNWNYSYMYASQGLPNNNIINIIEKAKKDPYKNKVLELFQTGEKEEFHFHNKDHNYLYMNGIIDIEEDPRQMKLFVKFSSPFVQKRLFHYFSNEIFRDMGRLVEPFEKLDDAVTDNHLNIRNVIETYQKYLDENSEWLFKDAPRRKDMRIFEAVYHFNLFRFLYDLLKGWKSIVYPEFPTGNGKIDILIKHGGKLYGLELKSFSNEKAYNDALIQTAEYGRQLGLTEISLVFFIESIGKEHKQTFETDFTRQHDTGTITVKPVFIQTG
jgi:hypothetical protein